MLGTRDAEIVPASRLTISASRAPFLNLSNLRTSKRMAELIRERRERMVP